MAQEVFDEEMVSGGDRPMIYDGGNIRIIVFDKMNFATVIHKDNVIARRGEGKGESRSKWEVLGFHGELKRAFNQVFKHSLTEALVDTHNNTEAILAKISECEAHILEAVDKIPLVELAR